MGLLPLSLLTHKKTASVVAVLFYQLHFDSLPYMNVSFDSEMSLPESVSRKEGEIGAARRSFLSPKV